MTPEQMAEEYLGLGERVKDLNAELAQINERYKPLHELREIKMKELQRLEKERVDLKRAYGRTTGQDLKKALREPLVIVVERTLGALIAAIVGEGGLPLDHPVVQRRLSDYREALNARYAAKAEGSPA